MLAFTFPGQGSQRSGMGHAWVEHPSWEVTAEASEIAGRDLTDLLLDAPMEELTRTANAQLATFVMSLVVLDAVERLGLFPAACAGHSLGEYTALVASGSLSLSDGTRLVVERGSAMQVAADERPGHHGRTDRHRRRRRRGGLPAGRGRRVGGQLQRPRPGGHRRYGRGGGHGHRPGQGAGRPQGAAHPRLRGLPHPADAAGPHPAPSDAGRGDLPLPRGPGGGQRRRPGAHAIRPSGPACCRPSCAARFAGGSPSRR